MKNVVAVFVIICLLISVAPKTMAENTMMSNLIYDTIDVYTVDTFREVFGLHSLCENNGRSITNQPSDISPEVTYSYKFIRSEDEANVILDCILYFGEDHYTFELIGTVQKYILTSGEVFWTGPIGGNLDVREHTYNLVAAFSKLDESPSIQVEVTIEPKSDNYLDFALFSFGEDVITVDIFEDIYGDTASGGTETEKVQVIEDDEDQIATIASAGPSYQFVGSSSGTVHIAGDYLNGQTVSGYFDSTQNIFVVSIKTYCASLEAWANERSLVAAKTNVGSCSATLTSNSHGTGGGSSSYIVNLCSFAFPPSNFNSGTVVIKALFEDLLGALDVPTSTISLILDSVQGKVSTEVYADTATASLSFGMFEDADFDASSVGLPFGFQLGCVESSYIGNSSYTFESSLQYCTYWWPKNDTNPKWFYHNANDASRTVTITLG